MPKLPILILHNRLKRLVKAAMNQTPHIHNPRPKRQHMRPTTRSTRLWWVRLDICVHPLPMLHLSIHRNKQLKPTRRRLVFRAPVILNHYRRSIADSGPEDFGRDPGFLAAGEAGGRAVEHLHLAGCKHGYDVEVPGGRGVVEIEVDVGLDECGPGLEDGGGARDHGYEGEVAGFRVTLGLFVVSNCSLYIEWERRGKG
jgi:hypothetical protein